MAQIVHSIQDIFLILLSSRKKKQGLWIITVFANEESLKL